MTSGGWICFMNHSFSKTTEMPTQKLQHYVMWLTVDIYRGDEIHSWEMKVYQQNSWLNVSLHSIK